METLYFNKIYVIESLFENDKKTGKELYDDLLRYQPLKFPSLEVEYCEVNNKNEWDLLMNNIINECKTNNIHPILHLEIHGIDDGSGLVLNNNEKLEYKYLTTKFREINLLSNFNLFITLAVCKGLFLLKYTEVLKPMPFCALLGSFEKILENELCLRFYEFYDELFVSFDLTKAFKRLTEANEIVSNSYDFIHIDDLFIEAYKRYINTRCTPEALKERALLCAEEKGIKLSNRKERRDYVKNFCKEEKKLREIDYHNIVSKFFLLNEYPNNKERFNIPKTLNELLNYK